jgi:hypothetical protein
LDFKSRVSICCEGVTLDEREIEAGSFPVFIALSFQTYLSGDQAYAHNTIFYIVVICFIFSGSCNCLGREEGQEKEKNA